MIVNDAAKQWELFSQACVRVDTEIDIKRPPRRVFDYASTPALWRTWHPATVEVREVPNRPLIAGETMLEVIAMAGRRDQAIWTVLACVPPERWEITTDTSNGMAHIIYTIVPPHAGISLEALAVAPSRCDADALDPQTPIVQGAAKS